MNSRMTREEIALIRRYLIWCYKTTKEELDRIDRKFTQLMVDRFMLQKLISAPVPLPEDSRGQYKKITDDFKEYVSHKERDAASFKFTIGKKKVFPPNYVYLKNRLSAIDKAILHFLGKKELKLIKSLYEYEMTKRILEAREHT